MRQFTQNQQRAVVTHNRNLVVVAGAGSGKTTVLVERYLSLLESHPEWPLNAVVAITFTRKAAREMRDRVRAELDYRAANTPNAASRAHWEQRIISMDSARINTIHGLCAEILRANAIEAEVDPQFEMLDEIQAGLLLDDALDTALAHAHQVERLVIQHSTGSISRILKDLIAADMPPPTEAEPTDDPALWHNLIQQARNAYRKAKAERGALDFDDLEKHTQTLLESHPAVRARYQNAEFRHLLVDEFQDTNARQWAIIQALTGERPGSLFIVGDPKQSIYAFRGADVSVFNQVRARLSAPPGEAITLSQSFRTHHRLAGLFNWLFAAIMPNEDDTLGKKLPDYEAQYGEPMQTDRRPPADHPALEVLLVNQTALKAGQDEADAGAAREIEAAAVAAAIARLTGPDSPERRLIWDRWQNRHRPAGYGDVAILFQAMTHVTIYEDALKTAGIPFITLAGRGYYDRQEVWDLINLLTALHNPADDLALAAALRSPLFSLSDDALLALRRPNASGERTPLWSALAAPEAAPSEDQPRIAFAHTTLSALRALAGRVTLADLLRESLARTGYLAVLESLPGGRRRRANVEKLLDKAFVSGEVMPGAFTAYLRDLSVREIRESEASVDTEGAVQLMTVHASKGLEFPIVWLADISRRDASSAGAVVFDRDLGLVCARYDPITGAKADKKTQEPAYQEAVERQKARDTAENKRKFYVAATRAQDYLFASGQFKVNDKGEFSGLADSSWLKWLLKTVCGDSAIPPRDGEQIERDGIVIHFHVMDGFSPKVVSVTSDQPTLTATGAPPAQAPALLRPVPIRRGAAARHLTATQVADLGAAAVEPVYGERFRRSVLYDAPLHLEKVAALPEKPYSRRTLGEIVHKALGRWRFPNEDDDLSAVLDAYAWQLGIVAPQHREQAVAEARALLYRFMSSDVYGWLSAARTLRQEMPFVYRTERRIIHGAVDVLFQDQSGQWRVVDYKTSWVAGINESHPDTADTYRIAEHARRYHLQVGVYAAAVREALGGITPDVYIHYIRAGQTVAVETADWSSALSQIEDHIGYLLVDGFDQE